MFALSCFVLGYLLARVGKSVLSRVLRWRAGPAPAEQEDPQQVDPGVLRWRAGPAPAEQEDPQQVDPAVARERAKEAEKRAKERERRLSVKANRLVIEFILVLVLIVAAIYLIYEFHHPVLPGTGDAWFHRWDYWFDSRVYSGRHAQSAQTGVLAFLLGMAVYTLRSALRQVWLAAQAAATGGSASPGAGAGPTGRGPPHD